MKKNLGFIDKSMRIVAALTIGVLYLTGVLSGTVAIVLGIFAVMFVLTSAVGSCPLYIPLKIDTSKRESQS
jgi:Protein of unknown function (DUF2892)